MISSDSTIKRLVQETGMISPFVPELVKVNEEGVRIPSYGLSSYGYDIRLQNIFKLFTKPSDGRIIDVLNFKETDFVNEVIADNVIIPPGGLLLGVSVERFKIPANITGVCVGKSTWARVGAQVLVTPLEAGWEGELVVEITNSTNHPLKIYAGVGIAQIQFLQGDITCTTSYSQRGGKYHNQAGVTAARL